MYVYNGRVVRVLDGDTLWIDIDLGCDIHTRMTVRLLGVDAPESGTPEGDAATAYVENWIGNHNASDGSVVVATTKDRKEKYGRYLAEVFGYAEGRHEGTADRLLNEMLVEAGHAVGYTGGKR